MRATRDMTAAQAWASIGFPVTDRASREDFYTYGNLTYQASFEFRARIAAPRALSQLQLCEVSTAPNHHNPNSNPNPNPNRGLDCAQPPDEYIR